MAEFMEQIGSVACYSIRYGDIDIEIPASKDMDGMYIKIDSIWTKEEMQMGSAF